jgi:hypothetical protein
MGRGSNSAYKVDGGDSRIFPVTDSHAGYVPSLDTSGILFGDSPARQVSTREADGQGGIVFRCEDTTAVGDSVVYWTRQDVDYQTAEKHGCLHRVGAPAVIEIGPNGYRSEQWCRDGECHRDDGPATLISYDGKPFREEWQQHGQLHREDGPASIVWSLDEIDGAICEEWFLNGLRARSDDGPASIFWDPMSDHELWMDFPNLIGVTNYYPRLHFYQQGVEIEVSKERYSEWQQRWRQDHAEWVSKWKTN